MWVGVGVGSGYSEGVVLGVGGDFSVNGRSVYKYVKEGLCVGFSESVR